jgi:hypothetical protein
MKENMALPKANQPAPMQIDKLPGLILDANNDPVMAANDKDKHCRCAPNSTAGSKKTVKHVRWANNQEYVFTVS